MKKRLVALILCALVIFSSVPMMPVADMFSFEAVAVSVEALEQVLATVPAEDKWADYINGDSLKYVYKEANDIIADPSKVSQDEIDECANDLAAAVAALKPYATEISLSHESLSVNVGKTASLTATLAPEKAGGEINWTSSHPSYVSVSSSGLVSANRYTADTVTITAEVTGKNGVRYSDTCPVKIINPVAGITISESAITLYSTETRKLRTTLIGFDSTANPTSNVIYTWDSDNTNVAEVSDSGMVTAKGTGSCNITVKVRNVGESTEYTASCAVTVNKLVAISSLIPETNLASGMISGEHVDFYIGVLPSNASIKKLNWRTTDSSIVDITDIRVTDSGKAVVTLIAGKVGTATLTYSATDGSGVSGSVTVEVKPMISSLTLSHTSKAITLASTGERITAEILPANAGNQVLDWDSSNKRVCTVDRVGVLTPVAPGETTITVSTTDGSNIVKTCKVIVCEMAETVKISADSTTVENGGKLQLRATVTTIDGYSYGDVDWSSSNEEIATVDKNGLVTAKYPGAAVIKAMAVDGSEKYDSCIIRVTQKITGISIAESITLSVGASTKLDVVISPSYATEKDLYWESSAVGVATVNAEGLVTGKNTGTAIITCKNADGTVYDTCTVKVIVPATGITISSNSEELWKGDVVQLVAIVTPAGATDRSVKWSTSNEKVATVTENGLVTAVAGGECIITATNSSGISESCRVKVYEDCTGVELGSTVKAMYVGQSDTIPVSIIPATATNKNVTWTSSRPAVASVDPTSGIIKALTEGSTVITVKTQNGGFTASCTVTVYSKVPVSGISLDRREYTVPVGEIYQLVAAVSPQNASEKGVVWSCDNTSVLAFDQRGRFKGLKAGTAILTATSVDGNFSDQCKITVTQPVTGVRITTTNVKLAVGKAKALEWTVFPENATNKKVTWKSSDINVATVTQSGVVTGVGEGVTVISATTVDGGFTSTCNFTVYVPVSGVSIVHNAQNTTEFNVFKGDTFLLSADIKPANATNKAVSWVSGNKSIATVNEAGQVTGVGKGATNITCTTADGAFRATCTVNVIQPVESITLDIASVNLEVGKTKTITAKVSPSTATYQTLKWSSSNAKIASVDKDGVVKAISAGTVTITAYSADGNAKTTCKVTVIQPVTGIKLNHESGYIRIGEVGVLKATVLPTNASNQKVKWASSDTSKATVTQDGVVKGIAQGYVNITATSVNGGFTATCKLLVVKSVTGIKLDKASITINVGKYTTITPSVYPADATVKTVYWTSSNYDVATVDTAGKVTAKAPGYAVITAKTKDGSYTAKTEVLVIQPVTGVTLNKTSSYLNLGATMTLVPTISPENASIKSVTWSSSDPSIATVSSSGVVTGLKKGVVTITCKTTNGAKIATCKISVVKRVTGISLNKEEAILYFGRALSLSSTVYPIDASVQDVIYTSNDTNIATVSAAGVVTPVNTGTTYIVATTKDGGYKAYCRVSVGRAPEEIRLAVYSATMIAGKSGTLKYAIYPTDARNRVATFVSSNPQVATVNSAGVVTAVSRGTAEITASTENGIKAVCKITVVQPATSVEISSAVAEVYTGEKITLSATVFPENANNRTVTWESSDTRIATVSENGIVTGVKAGTVTIRAISVDGAHKAECTLTVLQHVTSVEFVEREISINKGKEADLRISVLPYDATNKEVTFESSDRDVVTVTGEGHIIAKLGGQAKITVTTKDGGHIAECYITVLEPATGVSLNYNEKEVFVGDSLTLIATVSPADATNKLVRWSSDSAIASVTSDGVVTANKSGVAIITATTVDGDYTAECTLTLLQRATSVSVDKSEVKFNRGETYRLNAEVLPEDCYNKSYTWSSADENIATVDNTGLVTGVAPGEVILTCTSEESGVTATVKVTVHEPVTSVSIKNELTLYTPLSEKLEVEFDPANASDKSVTWESSDNNVLTVAEDGTLTAISKGEAKVTVTSNDTGVKSECVVTVLTGVEDILTEKDSYTLYENVKLKINYSLNPAGADNPEVKFESSSEEIFTVEADGTVTGIAPGKAELTITSVQNPAAVRKVEITVTRAVTDISLDVTEKETFVGDSFTLTATVSPDDATEKSVVWSSSYESVAKVENGVVTVLSRGNCEIIATTVDGGFEAKCALEAIQLPEEVVFDKEEYTVNVGATLTLNATVLPENTNDTSLTWESSDEQIAKVVDGVVTPVKAGSCEITAKSIKTGVEKTVRLTVVQLAEEIRFYCRVPDLRIGERLRVFATIIPEDTTDKSFTWSSADESIATIDEYGVITAVSGGEVQIIATSCDEGGVKGIINLKVVEDISGITLDKTEVKLEIGDIAELAATVLPAAAYDKTVTFESDNEEVAKVDANGKVTAIATGKATVTATTADGKFTATAEISVVKYPSEIQLYKTEFSLKTGEKEKIQYTLAPDGITETAVTWKSSDETVVTVSAEGILSAVGKGTANITISIPGTDLFATVSVTVDEVAGE
ncbi:MAG: Ig-like domain-containing protein [Clostridia bacterium]|nr:Ig-like domain-containing protein [Clostridia bacterium]